MADKPVGSVRGRGCPGPGHPSAFLDLPLPDLGENPFEVFQGAHGEVVEHRDALAQAPREQVVHQVEADEPAAAGHEDRGQTWAGAGRLVAFIHQVLLTQHGRPTEGQGPSWPQAQTTPPKDGRDGARPSTLEWQPPHAASRGGPCSVMAAKQLEGHGPSWPPAQTTSPKDGRDGARPSRVFLIMHSIYPSRASRPLTCSR
jgi:hypothetical protein